MASSGHEEVEKIVRECWTKLLHYISNEEKPKKKPLPQRSGELERRRVPLKEVYRLDKYRIRKLSIGSHVGEGASKTILVIGQTGSGKTTLIDGMFNYISRVNWDDPYRWQLTDLTSEEEAKGDDETVSRTEWITIYSLPKVEERIFPYCLNIIDTPGFGDTRGIEHDRKLVANLTHFFSNTKDQHEIMFINAVCFAVRAPDVRLTASQKYVFNAVMSIFGKDIKDSIFALTTFSDGMKPMVLQALKKEEISTQGYFKFNNSALFKNKATTGEDDEDEENIESIKLSWKMGKSSYKKFLDKLLLTQPKSTAQTAQVLQERLRLEAILESIKSNICDGVHDLVKLEKENGELKKCLEKAGKNPNPQIDSFKIESLPAPNPEGLNTLYCNTCDRECHYPCAKFALFKYFCPVFNLSGICLICKTDKKECKMANHSLIKTHVEKSMTPKTTTLKEIEKEHKLTGNEKGDRIVTTMDELNKKYRKHKEKVHELIKDGKVCYNHIKEIALKMDPLSDEEFIDELINEEMKQQQDGYMDRVKMLCDLKQNQQYVKTIQRSNSTETILGTVQTREGFDQYRRCSELYQKK